MSTWGTKSQHKLMGWLFPILPSLTSFRSATTAEVEIPWVERREWWYIWPLSTATLLGRSSLRGGIEIALASCLSMHWAIMATSSDSSSMEEDTSHMDWRSFCPVLVLVAQQIDHYWRSLQLGCANKVHGESFRDVRHCSSFKQFFINFEMKNVEFQALSLRMAADQ